MTLKLATSIALALTVSGCGGVAPGHVTTASFGASSGSLGTVVFAIQRKGVNCPKPAVTFAEERGGEYHKVAYAEMGNLMFGYDHYKAITMAPGTYHLAAVSCIDGRTITSLGKPKVEQLLGPIKTQTNKYERSLGTFKVERAGEVVNIGLIEMNTTQLFDGGPPLAVRELGPEAVAQIKSTNADLAARMVSRPLALTPMPDVGDLLAKVLAEAQAAKAASAAPQAPQPQKK